MQKLSLATNPLGKLTPLLIILILLAGGCKEKAKTPLEVTEDFWIAVQEKNPAAIKATITSNTIDEEITTENIVTISVVSFGKILINGNQSKVETEVTVDSDQPMTFPVNTLLVKENEQWKVDYDATMDAVTMPGQFSQLLQGLKSFGEKFSQELDNSMQEFDKSMPEIEKEISEMGEQFKEQLPELKQRFNQLADEIREAMKGALEEPVPDEPQKENKSEEEKTMEESYTI